jgi:hypothetical protein
MYMFMFLEQKCWCIVDVPKLKVTVFCNSKHLIDRHIIIIIIITFIIISVITNKMSFITLFYVFLYLFIFLSSTNIVICFWADIYTHKYLKKFNLI